ncbi:WD40/YVTN/BNR-like repeat-containing protein [Pseudomonas sp. UBA2684]|uniref:WD40/YVTN/BNR-like repeat-containing protein n=1 Tax=Pseudomonas sp. UBA2684 TaxID=1947311 RepID=UPI0025DFD7B0|nr:YCF48-related protein [Pseudomonas sp. UBA2684]|tara:strand:+ start:31906 stop:33054 length:1149 start_codon:yes stop_codon:yes gene_type:complete
MIGANLEMFCLLRNRQLLRQLCRSLLSIIVIFSTLLVVAADAASSADIDSLAEPAQQIDARLPAPVIGVARAGNDLFSVGPHGLILRSSDSGKSWLQVPSPVASDLVQVRFRDAQHGWIVGHDSLLLHTRDGGRTWVVQLDGRSLLTLLRETYGRRASNGDSTAQDMLQEIDFAMGTSASPDVLAAPLLDVLFDANGQGFVVGAFGMILRSTDDGATWEPWIERTENDRRMHLYALAEYQGRFFVSGEQGLLMQLDPQSQRFLMQETPYTGTYFGVRAFSDLLLVHGLRGNLFVSRDQGQEWVKVETGLNASLVSAVEQDGQLILVSQSGEMIAIDRGNLQVTPLQAANAGEVYAASATDKAGKLVVTRFSGAQVVEIAQAK